MSPITSLESVRSSLGRASGTVDATALQEAYDAAEGYVAERCRWTGEAPASLKQAVSLLTARLMARRNSPDGTVGMGDLGVVRVAGNDADVARLIAPHRRLVFG